MRDAVRYNRRNNNLEEGESTVYRSFLLLNIINLVEELLLHKFFLLILPVCPLSEGSHITFM